MDHYQLDLHWELRLKPNVERILVIDDLANRLHECDILLDQNFYLQSNRYQDLVPEQCIQLIGLDY